MIMAELRTKAKKLTNFAVDATGGGLWATTTSYKAECPAGKRWFLLPSVVYRDVNATLFIYHKDASGNIIAYLGSYSAGTGRQAYPEYDNSMGGLPVVIDAGEYIEGAFGVAQGATAEASCQVLEISI